jgi:hypothetical protein
MYEHIYGIVPPVTTPFRPDNTIDEQALRAAREAAADLERHPPRQPAGECQVLHGAARAARWRATAPDAVHL